MSDGKDIIVRPENGDEEEIDLLELAAKLWKSRRTIFIYAGVAAIIGLVVAFSIPKEYTTTIKLAPELSGSSSPSKKGLGSLASTSAPTPKAWTLCFPSYILTCSLPYPSW